MKAFSIGILRVYYGRTLNIYKTLFTKTNTCILLNHLIMKTHHLILLTTFLLSLCFTMKIWGSTWGYSGLFVRCLHLSTLHNATKPVYFYTVYYNDTLIRCICMVWRFFVLSGIGKFVDSSFIPE